MHAPRILRVVLFVCILLLCGCAQKINVVTTCSVGVHREEMIPCREAYYITTPQNETKVRLRFIKPERWFYTDTGARYNVWLSFGMTKNEEKIEIQNARGAFYKGAFECVWGLLDIKEMTITEGWGESIVVSGWLYAKETTRSRHGYDCPAGLGLRFHLWKLRVKRAESLGKIRKSGEDSLHFINQRGISFDW